MDYRTEFAATCQYVSESLQLERLDLDFRIQESDVRGLVQGNNWTDTLAVLSHLKVTKTFKFSLTIDWGARNFADDEAEKSTARNSIANMCRRCEISLCLIHCALRSQRRRQRNICTHGVFSTLLPLLSLRVIERTKI